MDKLSFRNTWDGVWEGIDQQNNKYRIVCRVFSESNVVKFSILYDDNAFVYFFKLD
jgi:hypothetical protein